MDLRGTFGCFCVYRIVVRRDSGFLRADTSLRIPLLSYLPPSSPSKSAALRTTLASPGPAVTPPLDTCALPLPSALGSSPGPLLSESWSYRPSGRCVCLLVYFVSSCPICIVYYT
jgi:hypothetical protein